MADKSFSQQLVKQFYTDPKFSDITFLVEDTEFKLHKIILAYSCPYFEAMLFGNTNEAKQSVIELMQTPKHLFKAVIDFIHTGTINKASFNRIDLFKLIGLSHEYQFKQFTTYLLKDMELGNGLGEVIETFVMADKYELSEVRQWCAKVVDAFASTITGNAKVFVKLPLSLVKEIVLRDTFESDELTLFSFLVEWKKAHSDEDIIAAFRELRLHHISVKDFNSFVKPTGLLKSDDYLISMEKCLPEREHKFDAKYCTLHHSKCSPVARFYTKVCIGVKSYRNAIDFDDEQQVINLQPSASLLFKLRNTCRITEVKIMLCIFKKSRNLEDIKQYFNVAVGYDSNQMNDLRIIDRCTHGSGYRNAKISFDITQMVKWLRIEAIRRIAVKPNSIRFFDRRCFEADRAKSEEINEYKYTYAWITFPQTS